MLQLSRLRVSCLRVLLVAVSCAGAGESLSAAEPSAAAPLAYFEQHIRPLLIARCYACHGAQKQEGGLRLDSREGWQTGGVSGPAVVPGKPEDSLLVKAVRYHDADLRMPPQERLPDASIAGLETWIREGAVDPRDHAATADEAAQVAWQVHLAERRQWWSLQPLTDPAPPTGPASERDSHPVDRFIGHRLAADQLTFAPPADPQTLFRRLSFVLTGLPPDPAESAAFVRGSAEDPEGTFRSTVDRLLQSPHFGEHWARHWMDVVRYTDTSGYEWDVPLRGAWEYRDYLIRAFNADVPFHQLVREQIAGDLLESPRVNSELQINESVIGTVFHHLGERRHGDSAEFNGIHQEMINDQVDAFSKAFQGLTVGCARCHDHKLDAVSQRDFYALAGVFMSSRWVTRTLDLPQRHAEVLSDLRTRKEQLRAGLAALWREDAQQLEADLLAAAAVAEEQESSRAVLLRKLLARPEEGKPAATGTPGDELADVFYPWRWLTHLQSADGVSSPKLSCADAWNQLADRYTHESAARADANRRQFRLLADFSQPLPAGWSLDGVGLREGATGPGEFMVALEGPQLVAKILPGGLFTSLLSPKLNGAVRSPLFGRDGPPFVSLEYLGGDYAAHRRVIENAFLTEQQTMLEAPRLAWQTFTIPRDTGFLAYIEFATKASNPNFPPRIGKLIAGGDALAFQSPPDELQAKLAGILDERRSWFGVTRALASEHPGAPRDELLLLAGLWQQPAPTSLGELAAAYSRWVQQAVQRWEQGAASEADSRLLQLLLDWGLLTNSSADSRAGELGEQVAAYRRCEESVPLPRSVQSMADVGPGRDYPLFAAGDYDQPRELVPRGYVEVLQAMAGTGAHPGGSSSGRRELAEQIASPHNPLTARVYVNRVWHWLFGQGLVATPDDFGHLGALPTHPELLDYLAQHFLREGCSTKELIRLLVTSRTWRQAGEETAAARERDPQNRLWHHYPLRRLEAESIRDALLAVSGRLDPTLYGPAIEPPRSAQDGAKYLFSGPLDGHGRRSLYIKVSIMEPPKFLAAFNQPAPKIPTGRRDVTNVPAQSLTLLNDPLPATLARHWAAELVKCADPDLGSRLERMFGRAFGRPPSPAEKQRWIEYVQSAPAPPSGRTETGAAADPEAADPAAAGAETGLLQREDVWADVAQALFNCKEFVFYR